MTPSVQRAPWQRLGRLVAVLLLTAIVASGCGPRREGLTIRKPMERRLAPGGIVELTGAGSSFVYPLFVKHYAVYADVQPGVRVNYQSIGSGAGKRNTLDGTVDFGATDAPFSDDELAKAGADVLHIPITLGSVAIIYNVPGVDGLRLTSHTLSAIYLGEITRWNDPALVHDNPGLALPDLPITPVERADGSGTTYIFTGYLAAVSARWQQEVGQGMAVQWPVGIAGKGNDGVAAQVEQTPGAIGYVELAYALQNNLPYASLQNEAGRFKLPTPAAATAAAAGIGDHLPPDLRFSVVNAPGEDAYPLVGVSWVLVRQQQPDPVWAKALVELLYWQLHDGQQYAADLHYAPLPAPVVERATELLRTVTVNGEPVLR